MEKTKRIRKVINMCNVFLPAAVLFLFLLAGIVLPDQDYSMAERRVLASKPKLTKEAVLNGKYMSDFESYTLDQFPLRDAFRKLKAMTGLYILRQRDTNGYYIADGYLSKLEYPLSENRLKHSIENQKKIYDRYLKDSDCIIYQSIIPDKNYYLAKQNGYPVIDYEKYVGRVIENVPYALYIDLFPELELGDYYHTDQHWRQEKLKKIVEKFRDSMHLELPMCYNVVSLDNPFYGAYYAQAALPMKPDRLSYMTNDALDHCIVTSFNTGKAKRIPMYDLEKASGKDPYEMFLGGSDALVTIENPAAKTQRELVVFRDSFGSSFIPLLAEGYHKITVVDLRYLKAELLGQFVSFDKQDVLFIYSTLVY